MNQIILFHGSEKIIKKPVRGKGNRRNDYGSGFYMTEFEEMAKEWACAGDRDGFANQYVLDMENLSVLYMTRGTYHILNWLAVLLENRTFRMNSDLMEDGRQYILDHFLISYGKYDVIVGYRADDSYFSFANAFLNNAISLQQLSAAMQLGDLGEQYVLKSTAAFEHISFRKAIPANKEIYYPKAHGRDLAAREAFRSIRSDRQDGVYLVDLLRGAWSNDDERLQRIVLG